MFLKNIFNFFELLFPKKKKSKIRKIYFGIRLRFLGLLFLVMIFIISFFTLMLYLNQRKTLFEEKKLNADKLIKILSSEARDYLDRDINTTKEEIRSKYQMIDSEANNFLKYNEFIEKIMLIDKNFTIFYSTDKFDLYKKYKFSYFIKCLEEKEEKTNFYKFKLKVNKKKERYLAITYPVLLQEGNIINIIDDFKKYYEAYYKENKNIKARYIRILWAKYKNLLSEDFFNEKNKDKISKVQDIDFLFLDLFSNIIKNRHWNIRRGETWLWNDIWLYELKTRKNNFNNISNLDSANETEKLIIERMNYLYSQIVELKRLGALAVLYDYDKITQDLNKDIKYPIYAALAFLVLSIIIFLFVINVIIKNLKILEKWAIKVSDGDINTKIKINTNDEIGRLSDVFNNMINEIKIKFHLEKFVSRSTKSMIDKESTRDSQIKTGVTGRKNLVFIFSDVRGFTSFTENNDPEEVIEILNMYFEMQAKIIKAKKGDIDDYVGDQIMAHFGGEKKADTALGVAIKIMREMKKVNEKRKKNNLPYFEIGIGVHGGEVVVGNIGASEFRMDFACLGDAVNLTSRLCSNAEASEILVSKQLYSQSNKRYKIKKHESIIVKGKANKIEVLTLLY